MHYLKSQTSSEFKTKTAAFAAVFVLKTEYKCTPFTQHSFVPSKLSSLRDVRHHLGMNAISLMCSIETHESTRLDCPKAKGQILNESTSSFRYPCLVTTYSLSLSLPWTIIKMSFGHSQLP